MAASQASKMVRLVAKYLFNKDLPLRDLPCPRTCLNFMNEANHIAKQHVVSKIRKSAHFTYATDGTSRDKKKPTICRYSKLRPRATGKWPAVIETLSLLLFHLLRTSYL